MTIVVGVLEFPNGDPCVGVRVSASLFSNGQPSYGSTGDGIVGAAAVLTGRSGSWSLDLEPNDNIEPSGTVWLITHAAPPQASVSYYIDVPTTGGPHQASDLIVSSPGAVSASELTSHNTSESAHVGVLQRRFAVDVRDHGAVGDGSTDDTAAITAARQAAAAAGNIPVFFPAGVWVWTGASITMNANERWIGANMRDARLHFPSATSSTVGVIPNDYCSIEHMAISSTSVSGSVGVSIADGNTRNHFLHVRFQDWGTGTRHENTWANNYTDCWWRGCSDCGIDNLELATSLTVSGGEMIGNGTAIRTQYALGHRYSGVTIEDGGYGYVSWSDYAKFAVSFAGCYFEGFETAAISTSGRQNDCLSIDSCFFSRCDYAIVLNGDAYTVDGTTGDRWGVHRARVVGCSFMSGYTAGTQMVPLLIGANAHQTVVGANSWHAQYGEGVVTFDPSEHDSGSGTIYDQVAYS